MKRRAITYCIAAFVLSCNTGSVQPIDTTRPAKVSDLNLDGIQAGELVFSWTASGDDGQEGIASYYDLRSAADSNTLVGWGGATQIQGEPAPSVSGTRETATIPNTFAMPRYFALKVSDESTNTSPISNIVCLCR